MKNGAGARPRRHHATRPFDFELDLDTFNAPLGMVVLFVQATKSLTPVPATPASGSRRSRGGRSGLQFPVLPFDAGAHQHQQERCLHGLFAEPNPRSETFVNGREATFGIPCPSSSDETCPELMIAQCDTDLTACEEAVVTMAPTDEEYPGRVVTRHAATPRSSSAGQGLRWVNALPMGNVVTRCTSKRTGNRSLEIRCSSPS